MKRYKRLKRGKQISICFIAVFMGLLAGCSSGKKQKVTLVITTNPYQIECGWDSEVSDAYAFLTKAAEEDCNAAIAAGYKNSILHD